MNPVTLPIGTGTVAVICAGEFTVNVARTPLKLTLVTFTKFAPVIVTPAPTAAFEGVNDEIVGAPFTLSAVKLLPLVKVPAGVDTLIGPVVAFDGTVAVICVSEFTVNTAAMPLKLTPLAPVKPKPASVTLVPVNPYDGENENTVKFAALVTLPPDVVTLIGPVVTPAGAVAVLSLIHI